MISVIHLQLIFSKFRKYSLLILLLSISFLFFYFHLYHYFTLDTLKFYQTDVRIWILRNYYFAVGIYIFTYAIMIACGIPCATFLALFGGFFFGSIAIIYATFSMTVGGFILYLAVHSTIGSGIATRSTGWIKKMEHGFQKNAFYYLLSLRLMPIFPCWISNIAAGALNVPIKIFILATILGILPANIIYVLAGRGLDKLLTDEKSPLLDILFTPSVFLSLLGLALISLFPVIYKYVNRNRK